MNTRHPAPRLALYASILAGASYLIADALPIGETLHIVWKGAGVALLAVYAALVARSLDGWLIAAVMALGALGDVLLETHGMTVGALAFFAGHLVAIGLYLRNRRVTLARSQFALAVLLVPATIALAYLLPGDRALAPLAATYAAGLGVMAACAWTSRFPRYAVGMGALAFLVSDLLIFARNGPLDGVIGVGVAVWVLYYLGQAMICVGVTGQLEDDAG